MELFSCSFAAALKDVNIWVMNVVPVNSADTLPIIYERGLFGIYHDWCESFNTYPRSYDLLHADHLFSKLKKYVTGFTFPYYILIYTLACTENLVEFDNLFTCFVF